MKDLNNTLFIWLNQQLHVLQLLKEQMLLLLIINDFFCLKNWMCT